MNLSRSNLSIDLTCFQIVLLIFPVLVLSSLQCISAPFSKSGELDTCRANFWMELSLFDMSKQDYENAKIIYRLSYHLIQISKTPISIAWISADNDYN